LQEKYIIEKTENQETLFLRRWSLFPCRICIIAPAPK